MTEFETPPGLLPLGLGGEVTAGGNFSVGPSSLPEWAQADLLRLSRIEDTADGRRLDPESVFLLDE